MLAAVQAMTKPDAVGTSGRLDPDVAAQASARELQDHRAREIARLSDGPATIKNPTTIPIPMAANGRLLTVSRTVRMAFDRWRSDVAEYSDVAE